MLSIKVWIKRRFADKALVPVRDEIATLVPEGSSLLEIGSGTGSLLFQLTSKLTKGVGVDTDTAMVNYAQNRVNEYKLENIKFINDDARNLKLDSFDISTSTLCLHEVGLDTSLSLLKVMLHHSQKVIIADYTQAHKFHNKVMIELDEMISGHYKNFKNYRRNGDIPFLTKQLDANIVKIIETPIDGISLWVIQGNKS